jgi:plastocyanin
LDKISADETIKGVIEAHDGFVDLYITSNLVEFIDIQLNIYESGNDSASHVLHEIHEAIEEEEAAMAALHFVDGEVAVKELPPNTVDMPIGAGVPGCETNDMCYTPSRLTVHTGTTVTWINSDGSIPHTVTAGWPESDAIDTNYLGGNGFDSDFMSGGAEFEHTFETPGEYDYYCQLHPWMLGSILVE